MDKKLKRLMHKAEELGWSYCPCHFANGETGYEFEKFSTYGQDFIFTLSATDTDGKPNASVLIDNLRKYINSFEPAEEARIWLGASGTPQDYSDILDDMKECGQMMEGLLAEWEETI